MRTTLSALLISTLVLGGCGAVRDSQINPFNWFGSSRAEARADTQQSTNQLIPVQRRGLGLKRPKPTDTTTPVDSIKDMHIERVAGGAVIRVKGVSAFQGSYGVKLVAENGGAPVKNTLTYTLKADLPGYRSVGPETSRELVAAVFISDQELAGVRTVRVQGARNARSSRRR